MTAIIDADSLIYIIGWNFRPKDDDDEFLDSNENKRDRVIEAVDINITNILQAAKAKNYIIGLGHPTVKCFRNDAAKFKEYKGQRKPDNPTIALWKPVIKERLFTTWGAVAVGGIEADDICSIAAEQLRSREKPFIVCSIDKDLMQIGGRFYDYKKLDYSNVSKDQAEWLFWYQMICGDSGDGVAGIPKKGPVAAHKILDHLLGDNLAMERVVRGMYYDHFGDNYGKTIFEENRAVLGMMTSDHLYFEPEYAFQVMAGLREVPECL